MTALFYEQFPGGPALGVRHVDGTSRPRLLEERSNIVRMLKPHVISGRFTGRKYAPAAERARDRHTCPNPGAHIAFTGLVGPRGLQPSNDPDRGDRRALF